ncbi:unnamed protein product [Prunus armeniaca]
MLLGSMQTIDDPNNTGGPEKSLAQLSKGRNFNPNCSIPGPLMTDNLSNPLGPMQMKDVVGQGTRMRETLTNLGLKRGVVADNPISFQSLEKKKTKKRQKQVEKRDPQVREKGGGSPQYQNHVDTYKY